jgi:hypothetical protein
MFASLPLPSGVSTITTSRNHLLVALSLQWLCLTQFPPMQELQLLVRWSSRFAQAPPMQELQLLVRWSSRCAQAPAMQELQLLVRWSPRCAQAPPTAHAIAQAIETETEKN